MTLYLHMQWLGNNYYDVDIEFEVLPGDDSVGYATDYEFTATITNEYGLPVDITDELTTSEIMEVFEAIEKELERDDY